MHASPFRWHKPADTLFRRPCNGQAPMHQAKYGRQSAICKNYFHRRAFAVALVWVDLLRFSAEAASVRYRLLMMIATDASLVCCARTVLARSLQDQFVGAFRVRTALVKAACRVLVCHWRFIVSADDRLRVFHRAATSRLPMPIRGNHQDDASPDQFTICYSHRTTWAFASAATA
jgi:hypothetical protein